MPQTAESVRDLLLKGEGQSVEFKTRLRDGATLARLITAFGNSEGGVVLVGIGDRGEVHGADLEEVSRAFHLALASVRNAPRVDLESVSLDGKQVATITIRKGGRLVLERDGAFTRVADHIEPMPASAISRALAPEAPDERDSIATAIHSLTVTVETLRAETVFANSFRGQLRNYLVSGLVGAVLGFVLSKLLG